MIFMVSMIRISSQNLFHREIGSFSRKNLLFLFFLGEGENYVVRQKKKQSPLVAALSAHIFGLVI